MEHPWFQNEHPERQFDRNIINSLRRFNCNKKLKREALNVIVKACSDEEIQHLTEQFRKLDIDHTGFISAAELQESLRLMNINMAV